VANYLEIFVSTGIGFLEADGDIGQIHEFFGEFVSSHWDSWTKIRGNI
jgi:hypothetical protein